MVAAYRTAQFLRSLTSKPRSEDLALLSVYLPPSLAQLLHQMSYAGQVHSLHMLRSLIAQEKRDPQLLAAARLHDVGKSHIQLHLWERVLIVLANWLIPDAARRWGVDEPAGPSPSVGN